MEKPKDVPASAHIPPPSRDKINSLKALCMLAPPEGQEGYWCVYSYVLNREVCKSKGEHELDNLYGMDIMLGVYPNEDIATKRAKYVTETTGYGCRAAPLCVWNPLLLDSDPKRTTCIHKDVDGKILDFEDQEYQRQQELYFNRLEREKATLDEQERELDPEDISHYKYHWLAILKNKVRLEDLRDKLDKAQQDFDKHKSIIEEHYNRHPKHDKEWLEYLISIGYSGEEVNIIKEKYELLKPEILGLRDPLVDSLPSPPSVNVRRTMSKNAKRKLKRRQQT
jgi:hypothetical protein